LAEGTWSLTDNERRIVLAAIEAFEPTLQSLATAQLNCEYLVHREGGGGRVALINFFDKVAGLPTPEVVTIRIDLSTHEAKQKVYVEYYKGILHNIQFYKSQKLHKNSPVKIMGACRVSAGGYIASIDSEDQ